MLGGSTGINLLAWDRASELEYNAWQTLADNSDWNFKSLLPYFKKAETVDLAFASKFPGPSPAQYAAANEEFKVDNGFNGPIHVSRSYGI
jgi:choline dehydrogenase-like flavoprotein